MGIYDREYYRREGPGFLGSLAGQGRVTTWLIGINVACFLAQMFTRRPVPGGFTEPFTNWLILDVNKVLHGEVWRLLTYAFLHDTNSIFHIIFNMLGLYFFGRQVEDTIGGREYLWFYLVAAVVSGLAFTAASLLGLHGGRALGASGAVIAVLVLAAMYNPRQVVYVMFLLPLPIWVFIVALVAIDAFNLLGGSSDHVATSAHLGGAAFAFAYHKLQWRVSGWLSWLPSWSGRRSRRPKLRLYREEEPETPTPRPAPHPAAPRALDDEQLEAQVDTILEKINRVGMEGLTDQERQVLVRASEQIKRRRS